jgi:hypothetical protein
VPGLIDAIKLVLARVLGVDVSRIMLREDWCQLWYSPLTQRAHNLRGDGFLGGARHVTGLTAGLPVAAG